MPYSLFSNGFLRNFINLRNIVYERWKVASLNESDGSETPK